MVNQVRVWDAVIAAPFGRLGVQTEMVDGSLMISQVVYLDHDQALKPPKTALAKELETQFNRYFKNPQFIFDLPLKPFGTIFQQRVWSEIEKISCGEVKTYGALAKSINSAPRAVGQACGSNPYPLIVPCHRVVSATGIGGFAHQAGEGFHRNVKAWLLHHEGVQFK
jgi:methylated-DNA-[protein]-cysteine S-methyltransferase